MNVQQLIEFVSRENKSYIIYDKDSPNKFSENLRSWKENEYLNLRLWNGFNPEQTAFFNELGGHLVVKKPPKFK